MARGPIKHTCPDIDRQKGWTDSQLKEIKSIRDNLNDKTYNQIDSALEDAYTRLDELNDFLEEIRESNDALRTWGAEMEDLAEERAREIESLESQVSSYAS